MQERATEYWNQTDQTDQTAQGQAPQRKEGPVAKAIEQQTAKLPSDVYLWAAIGSMGVSAVLQLSGKRNVSNFFGLWAPCLLMFGLYNKMVKLMGSEGGDTR